MIILKLFPKLDGFRDDEKSKIENSNFTENTAFIGGAVYLSNSELQVSQSRFERNKAISFGGAIVIEDESVSTHKATVDSSANEKISSSKLATKVVNSCSKRTDRILKSHNSLKVSILTKIAQWGVFFFAF